LLLSLLFGVAVVQACTVVYSKLGEVPSSFEVRFERAGKPLSGVRVSIGQAETTSGADGAAKFSRVPVGHHTLYADLHGLQIAAYSIEVLARKADAKPLKIVWDDQGFAVGRVVGKLVKHQFQGPDLGPISAAKLTLISIAGGASQDAVSLEDGSFDFNQMASGDYILRIDGGHLLLRLYAGKGPATFQIGMANTSCGQWLFPKS
jgi:hypothetical protein